MASSGQRKIQVPRNQDSSQKNMKETILKFTVISVTYDGLAPLGTVITQFEFVANMRELHMSHFSSRIAQNILSKSLKWGYILCH